MPGSVDLSSHPRGGVLRWGRRGVLLATIAVVGGLGACEEATVCRPAFFHPIEIEVRDASTGAHIARGAVGTIQDGDFVSPLMLPNPESELYLVAAGGPGIYDVRIQKEGYLDWEKRRVFVTDAGCGQPRTVFLKAELTPVQR